MIPAMNIVAWSKNAPWPEDRQVEQDLVICRALVEIFNDEFLRKELRFRGGTALNKLHFPKPYRYSEDIDLTRTTEGAVGPILDRLRAVLEPWMGRGHYDLGEFGPRLTFTMKAEDENASQPIRVKVEIATRERTAYDGAKTVPFEVKNPWFTGKARYRHLQPRRNSCHQAPGAAPARQRTGPRRPREGCRAVSRSRCRACCDAIRQVSQSGWADDLARRG